MQIPLAGQSDVLQDSQGSHSTISLGLKRGKQPSLHWTPWVLEAESVGPAGIESGEVHTGNSYFRLINRSKHKHLEAWFCHRKSKKSMSRMQTYVAKHIVLSNHDHCWKNPEVTAWDGRISRTWAVYRKCKTGDTEERYFQAGRKSVTQDQGKEQMLI